MEAGNFAEKGSGPVALQIEDCGAMEGRAVDDFRSVEDYGVYPKRHHLLNCYRQLAVVDAGELRKEDSGKLVWYLNHLVPPILTDNLAGKYL